MQIEILSKRIGRRLIRGAEIGQRQQLADSIWEIIDREIEDKVVLQSPGTIRNLLIRIRTKADFEASAIFRYAVNIARTSRSGEGDTLIEAFDHNKLSNFLTKPGDLALANGTFRQSGTVFWESLSDSWQERKQGINPAVARKFFINTGSLTSLLERNAKSYVNRLGGTKASMWLAREKRGTKQRRLTKHVLGDITVTIFPSLSMAMVPMLASGRWTDHNDGEFEKKFFRGDMAEKLAGPDGKHRPLILPLIQFFMAFRIPRAIKEAVEAWQKGNAG